MSRGTDINSLPMSEATRKLNAHLFGDKTLPTLAQCGAGKPLVVAKRRKLGQKMCDDIARDVLEMMTPPAAVVDGPRYRSKWEREYHGILKAKFPADWIEFEPIRLKLAEKANYTPDFIVRKRREVQVGYVHPDSIFEETSQLTAYEVKGFWREAARVRIKVAARLFPWIRFIAVRKQKKKDGGGWVEEVFPS
jgi:hypothetical protein